MLKRAIVLSAVFVLAGCTAAGVPEASKPSTSAVGKGDPMEAISKVGIGMRDSKVTAIMAPVAQSVGTVFWGGSGAKRMYFQVGANRQVWFEIGGSYDRESFGRVVEIGRVEPKQRWVRHGAESITVE